MTYTLGDVDWKRLDREYGFSDMEAGTPFENFDPTLTYAEWFDTITDEIVWITELIDLAELEEEYTVAVFDPPEDMSEEAQKICESIHWNDAQNDVNRLSDLGIEPIARVKVSFLYESGLTFKSYVVFDGEEETISHTLAGNTVSEHDRHRIYVGGRELTSWRGGENAYTDKLAEEHGGKFAVILEDVESGKKFRKDTDTFSVEKYLKED